MKLFSSRLFSFPLSLPLSLLTASILSCTHGTEQGSENQTKEPVQESSSSTSPSPSGAPASERAKDMSHHEMKESGSKVGHDHASHGIGTHKKSHHKKGHYKKGHYKKGEHHHSADEAFFKDAKFGDLEVKAHDFLYLSGQPSLAAVKDMKAQNVQLYVDIRPKSEVGPEFVKMIESHGIMFVSKPVFLSDGSVDFKAVDEVYALHKKYHDVGHVVGCTSGVRSSGWLTLHLIKHHKMAVEDGIKIGKTAYLSEPLAENIRKVVK
jgi:protein tyrosine phosphatase (PTP) superfamily phosphohydrolase (DUF442 family)